MSRRYNSIKPSNRLRTSAKLALTVAGTTIAGLIILLIIVFNMGKQEASFAEGLMVFESAEVIQDSSAVLRGSINQVILGVEVKTSGNKNPVKLSAITFTANGTTAPVSKNIENARLWFTGKENNFNTSVQIGQTIPQITENNIEIIVNRTLNQGKNYFWLTYDIKPDAGAKNTAVDAECVSLQIGTSTFMPMLASPAGKKKILSNVPYFSTGHTVIYQRDAWNTKRDGSGLEPAKLDDIHNCYFIQSGHSITNTGEISLASIVVEKHASLKASQPVKTKMLYVADGGIYQQEFVINENNPVENFRMDNGANYIHLNYGKLPGTKKMFSPHSNQCFYQYSAETFSEKIKWGNVLINASGTPVIDISNAFNNIQGDLEIHKTGNNNYLYSGSNDTINIGGSLIFSGGSFIGANGTGTSLVINVAEDLIMKSGTFFDSDGKKGTSCILNINGDVLLLAGTFNFNKCKEGLSQINFTRTSDGQGSNYKTSYWSQKSPDVELGNTTIMTGKELIIQGGKIGELGANRKFTVESDASLMCGQFPVSGNGAFVLKENATIGIGSPQGINSATQDGNIQTKEKYFDSRAHYLYNTGSTPQQTGFFVTAPENGKVKTMIIKKDKPTDAVMLSQDMEVTDQLMITMGQLDKKKNKIILSKLSDTFTKGKTN